MPAADSVMRTARRWTRGAVLCSVLMTLWLAWMHERQNTLTFRATQTVEHLRQARVDLAQGVVHIALSGDPSVPFDREQGLVLVRQALGSFRLAVAQAGVSADEDIERFRSRLAAFEQLLRLWDRAPAGRETALRIACHELDRDAARVDLASQAALRRLTARLDREYLAAVVVAVLLLTAVCAVVWGASRAMVRAEQARHHGAQQLRATIDTIADGIVAADSAGLVVVMNEAAERLTGWSESRAAGQPLSTVLRLLAPGTSQPLVLKATPSALDADVVGPESRLTPVAVRVSHVVPARGDAGGTVVAVRDRSLELAHETERRRLEDELAQAQKLESIGRLAGGIAHDFNNLLTVIIGHVDAMMMLSTIAPGARSSLLEIRHAAERSAGLTAQLLAYARRQTVAPRAIDLNEAIAELLGLLRRLMGEDIRLEWRPGHLVHAVLIDPSQIQQLVTNLCANARDAIRGTGHVTIETGAVSLDRDVVSRHPEIEPGRFIRLSVSDNGSGMGPDELAHLFEPFYTTKGLGRGTGLGLATVYGIVRQNRGAIDVVSAPGRGTTMSVFLPIVARDTSAVMAPPEAAVPHGSGQHVLFVEDEPAILRLGVMTLDSLGYVVSGASSAGEALRLVADLQRPLDLLVTDVVMPDMNGHELAERLRARYPDLACLYMSGYTADVIATRGVLADGVAFLQKPFDRTSLGRRVGDLLAVPAAREGGA